MKILESKYYQAKKILAVNNDEYIQLIDAQSYSSSDRPFKNLLNDLLSSIYTYDEDLIIQNEKIKNFIQCTDFYTAEYSSELNKIYEVELCFFHPELEIFIITSQNLSNRYDSQIFEEELLKINCIFYKNTHPKAKENLEILFSKYIEKYISKDAKISILIKTSVGMELKTHTIKPHRIDLNQMYNNDFQEVHQKVKESLTTHNKGVVLFHGIPGSGKTNYIKWLTSQIPNKKFIFIPTSMIPSLTDPAFIEILIENKNSILVLEDCENYIAERTSFSLHTDVVSSILNIADGMLSDVLECQLICTFNSDISKIDNALLRKGRLIAEYKFKELSIEKCNQYLAFIGKNIQVKTPHSLAELTNIDHREFKNTQEKKIGF